jgi:hypothetical protein
MDGKQFFQHLRDPAGRVISPLLANIALHGMDDRIKTVCRYPAYSEGVHGNGITVEASP